MCGFIAGKKLGIGTNEFISRRGEDHTSTLDVGDIHFSHSLLSLTGDFTPQPFVDGDVVAVYNGEIYNQPFTRSDGECIIPLYRQHGPEFVRWLDGEFAIALYDFGKGIKVFSTDAFRTKPIYWNADGAASYPSGLKNPSVALQPNSAVVCKMDGTVERTFSVHDFDFSNQSERSYNGWISAFESAIVKRATGKRVFLGLSSGYDSGAIHCALQRLRMDFKPFSITGSENPAVLKARGAVPMEFSRADYERMKAYLSTHMEDFEYQIFTTRRRLRDEDSAFAMAFIMLAARAEGRRIYLSGQGADEIISDYAPWHGQSEFRGTFPAELKPWKNFYGHAQEAYLAKEEHVGGTFSVETRYPFLDLQVVQEFLWLHVDWKNRNYKAPIREYFLRCGYPFKENEKLGFNPRSGF